MNKIPADGERAARIGYEAQDKRAANLIYNILVEGRLEWLKIADPKAGRIDDIQIATTDGELHAFQVKWAETAQTITFAEITRSGKVPSLIAQLADGWRRLKTQHPDKRIFVHLIHKHIPYHKSPLDDPKIKLPLDDPPPLQSNFQDFIRDCWKNKKNWLPFGLSSIPQGWRAAMEVIRREADLPDDTDFLDFIAASFLHFGYQFPEPDQPADRRAIRREKDVDQIARLIAKLGGGEKHIIQVTRADLLRLLSWESRFEFRFKHEFPVDETLYQPITQTVEELEASINQFNSGYIALIGTPGSGKSTTLTQTLRYRKGLQVIRYYAYVPNSPWQEGRGEATSFLHDLHLALQRQGIYVRTGRQSQPESLEELREALTAQLGELQEKWRKDKIITLIIVDGLDHIEREQSPERSLLKELPGPENIPEGVLLVLGSQTLVLNDFPDRIRHHLNQPGRTITLQPLPRQAVLDIISASALPFALSHDQQETINVLSNGHPLALRYLLASLANASDENGVKEILNSTEPYQAHIEENYRIYWDKLQRHEGLKELLALLCRLRGPFNPEDLLQWVGKPAVQLLLTRAKHYFWEESDSRWHFFHNSFRQFILGRTRSNIFGKQDLARDKAYHQRLADYAAAAKPENPWAWEELYHRACSEDWGKVLQIGTQEYFRKQFMNLRHIEAILQDTGLCLKAARIKRDGLAIIRIFLIEKELGDRQENIDPSDIDLPALLYEVHGMDAAMHYVMDGQQVRIEQKKAMRFAEFLIEKGKLQAAEKVFNAAEPLDVLNGSTPVESIQSGNLETIYAWVEIAHYFRPLSKLLNIIEQLRSDTRHILQDQNPDEWHRGVRQNVLMALSDAIFDCGDEKKLSILKELLKQREGGDIFLRRLDFHDCTVHRNQKSADVALGRLMQWAEKLESKKHSRLRIAEFIYRIRGDKETAAEWIAGISQPPLRETLSDWNWGNLNPFLYRIRLNRLLAALGQPADPTQAVPDDEPRRRGGVLFERNLVIIANLWGQAWAGKHVSPNMILRQLHPALSLFSRNWQETRDWTIWHSYRKCAPDFYTFMVHAVAEHGSEALQALAKEFDRRWKEQPQYWEAHWQRAIALALYRRGCPLDDLIRRLDSIEAHFSVQDDTASRISELSEQAFAWLEAQQHQKAHTLFPKLSQDSFGIVYDKDYQFSDWVEWLGKTTSALPGGTAEDIRRFAAALVVLERTGRGRGTQEAAANLIRLVAKWNPTYTLKLKDWLLAQHAIHYTVVIEGILRAAVLSPKAPLEMVCILTCHLLIPFTDTTPNELPKLLAQQCALRCSQKDTQALLQILNDSIGTKAYPSHRAEWWRGIIQGLQLAGADATYFQAKLKQDVREKRYESDLDVHLKSGEKLSQRDALLRINSGQDLLAFIDQIEETKYFRWDEAIVKIINTLNRKQIYALKTALKGFEHRPTLDALFAKRLKILGYEKEGRALLQPLLDQSVPQGWDRHWDGGSRLSAVQAFLDYDPEQGRAMAYDLLVNDYLSARRYPRSMIDNLEDYLPLLFDKVPIVEIWQEIREHIYQLNEFAYTGAMPPHAEEHQLSWQAVLPQLIVDAMQIEVPEIKEEAHRACCKLCQNPAYDAESSTVLNGMLEGEESQICQALAVLESVLGQRPEAVAAFVDKLSLLSSSPNMTIRTMANGLVHALHIPASSPDSRPLAATYYLELPDFPMYDEVIPFASLPLGASFPDSDDPLEMVRPFQNDFELLSDLSGIPKQNLINRAAVLMKTLSPKEYWNKQAEEDMKAWLNAANLKLTYHRLRPQQALRAMNHVAAELADAGKLNDRALTTIMHWFRQHDRIMSCKEPAHRPADIVLPDSEKMGFYRDKDWVNKGTDSFALMPERFQDGRIVLAELTRICHLGWEMPTEYRFSMLCHPDWSLPEELRNAYQFYPYKSHWGAEGYPKFINSKEPAIAIYGNPRTVELGSQEWLAFNPTIALHLGWESSNVGMFHWVDTEGRTTAESICWKDGPINRLPPRNDECSEGWIVLASEEVQEKIKSIFTPIVRKKTVIRKIKEKDEGDGETVRRAFTQSPL